MYISYTSHNKQQNLDNEINHRTLVTVQIYSYHIQYNTFLKVGHTFPQHILSFLGLLHGIVQSMFRCHPEGRVRFLFIYLFFTIDFFNMQINFIHIKVNANLMLLIKLFPSNINIKQVLYEFGIEKLIYTIHKFHQQIAKPIRNQ